jgi:hypothetical protein
MLANECYAERYALTLRLMLAGLRRKTGALSTMPGTPRGNMQTDGTLPTTADMASNAFGQLSGGLDSLLSLPQMGEAFDSLEAQAQNDGLMFGGDMMDFSWPTEFSPSNLPVWLQDGVSVLPLHPDRAIIWGIRGARGLWLTYRTLRTWDYRWTDRIRSSCLQSE